MTLLAFIAPETARNVLLIVAGLACLAYHLVRWWRKERGVEGEKVREGEIGEKGVKSLKGVKGEEKVKVRGEGEQRKVNPSNSSNPSHSSNSSNPSHPQPGEDLFRRARAMRHQRIPDYRVDGLYLDQLGDSAAKGYAPAMAKLGEYAMRRRTWVEAYYWMSLAKRQGMPDCDAALRDIRRKWMMAGSPDETWNVYELFSEESGSIGRALLNVASGRDVYAAKKFLAERLPPVRQ